MTPAAAALTLCAVDYESVRAHLFPGDGREAAAILVCARTPGPRLRLLVRYVVKVPHLDCSVREPDLLTWPGQWIESALDLGDAEALSLILIHSHPGGLFAFSPADDRSDQLVLPSLFQAYGDAHGTAIMTPDGAIRARVYNAQMQMTDFDCVSIIGTDIQFFWREALGSSRIERPIAFTSGMTSELARLHAAVIGVSGTGSIVCEQLARLGIGGVTMIDFDHIEGKNLNRILNSKQKDAADHRLKVEMFADAIAGYRGEGVAWPVAASIMTPDAVMAASQADILFSCVDTLEARHVADLIAQAFLIPTIDVGVSIPTRQCASGVAIADACGRIDYIHPKGSSLRDRGVYSPESLREEYIRQTSREAHQQELDAGYIKGLAEEAPAVITLNMRAAAACVSEFIARAYPFRTESNALYARTMFSISACEEDYFGESAFPINHSPIFARGSTPPLLGLPVLSKPNSGVHH